MNGRRLPFEVESCMGSDVGGGPIINGCGCNIDAVPTGYNLTVHAGPNADGDRVEIRVECAPEDYGRGLNLLAELYARRMGSRMNP